MIKNNNLVNFIERLNSYQIIRIHPFLTLYNKWFLEVMENLKNEIKENLSLPAIDKKLYLENTKERIVDKVAYQKDGRFLDNWIKEYDLYDLKFPFKENDVVEQILKTSINKSNLDYESNKLFTNLQIDFYCHAAMVEKYKMIEFIDELLEPEIKKQQSEVPDDRLVVPEEVIPKKSSIKYPEKWYALQYLLELKANGLKPPLSTEGTFIRKDLEAIGSSRTGKSGQMFYRSVLNHYKDLDKPEILEKSFGKDWKETILTLSNGDNTLKDYLDKHY